MTNDKAAARPRAGPHRGARHRHGRGRVRRHAGASARQAHPRHVLPRAHRREGLRAGRRVVLLELALRAARAAALQPGLRHRRHDRHARPGDAAGRRRGASARRSCMADCVSEHGHEPIAMDPRHQLRRQVERCQERGFEPVLATEIEFYLTDEDGKPVLRRHPVLLARRRAPRSSTSSGDVRRVDRGLRHRRRGLEHRVRPGAGRDQLRPRRRRSRSATARSSSSRSCARSRATTACARRSWPSRSRGVSGNGLHLHHSLRKDGVNVFDARHRRPAARQRLDAPLGRGPDDARRAARAAREPDGQRLQAHRGLLLRAHARELGPRQPQRRRALHPAASAPASRVEYRGGAADANPYLLAAARAGGGHGRHRARARAAAGGREGRLRRRAPAAPAAHAAAPRSRPGRRRRSRARRSASASPTTTRASPATTLRSTTRPSPTGKRSATGSSHSLGGNAHDRTTDNDC